MIAGAGLADVLDGELLPEERLERATASFSAIACCPVPGTSPPVGLCPKTPLKNAGMRIDPPMSEPSPNGDAPAPTIAPSPPELPPTMRDGSYGLFVRP